MTKTIIAMILLTLGVAFVSYGVNNGDIIFSIIGGSCLGFYHSIITYKQKQ